METHVFQHFSVSNPIMNYITKNPSTPKVYQKLIKTCKYFFVNNPIIVIPCIKIVFHCNNEWLTCLPGENCDHPSYILKLNNKTKIWPTKKFFYFVKTSLTHISSTLIPKIYRCNVTNFQLLEQHISLKEFIFLTSSVKTIFFNNVVVKDNNGTTVTLDKIVKKLPNLECLSIVFDDNDPCIESNTVKKLVEIEHLKNYCEIEFSGIPENFDMETFFSFMKDNKYIKYNVSFNYQLPDSLRKRLREWLHLIHQEDIHEPNYCWMRL